MERSKALAEANRIITEWVGEKVNQRGYTHDKWQPTDLAERTAATVKLAAFLLVPTGPLVPPAKTVEFQGERISVFGWMTDGTGGPPTASQYSAAKSWSADTDPTRLVDVRMVDGVRALLETYEEEVLRGS